MPKAHASENHAPKHLDRAHPQARSAETRSAILDAAGPIFAESGLAGARTEAIAAAAGVNKALLYYYFQSKEDLYYAVLDENMAGFHQSAMEVLNRPGCPRAILLEYCAMHFDFICARLSYAPLYQQMMASDGKGKQQLARKYLAPRSEAVRALLARGMQEGVFRQADVNHTSLSMVAVVAFFFTAAPVLKLIDGPSALDDEHIQRRKEQALEFIRFGIFADPNAPLP